MRISDWSSDVCSSDLRVVQLPFTLHIMPARGCGDAAQDVVKARENADVAQFGFSSSPHDSASANKLTAFADPDVGLDAAISRDRAIVNILPRAERRVGPSDNSFVEGKADCGDGTAGKKQGRQYLMRGKSRRFHGYDFAVLVQRDQCEDGAQRDRKREKAGDDLRHAQPNIPP